MRKIARRGSETFKFKTVGGVARELRIQNGTYDDSALNAKKSQLESLQMQFVTARNAGDERTANSIGQQVCDMMHKFIMDIADKKYKNYIEADPFIKDDLVQSAYLAIFENLPKYDSSKGAPSTFFVHPINHNMFTIVNGNGGVKRHQAVNIKRIKEAIEELNRMGIDNPTNADLCIMTGMDMNQVIGSRMVIERSNTVNITDDFDIGSAGYSEYGNPERAVEESIKNEELRKIVLSLPEYERKLVTAVFYEGMQVKTLAERLGTTEEKIRKALNNAINLIRYDSRFEATFGKKREVDYNEANALSLIPEYSASKTADALFNQNSEELEIMFD